MVIVSIITLTADLAVNILVYPTPQPGLCDFDHGLVMNWTEGADSFLKPPSNSYPAQLASNAQIYSLDNGCEGGIFRKVPWAGNTSFCANDLDIMGSWVCQIYADDYNFDGSAESGYIAEWLVNNSLQYNEWSSNEYFITSDGIDQPSHVVIWSSSIGSDETGSPFTVLASVDLNGTYTDTKTIRTYQCKVTADNQVDLDSINGVLSQMPSNSSLYEWAPGLEAVLYMGDGTDIDGYAGYRIASRLNSMTMVQGGSNSIKNPPLDSDYPFYGCVLTNTYISPAILTLIGFAGLCLVIVGVYWITLLLRLGKHALPGFFHSSDSSIKPVPDSILSWMLQASRENALGGQLTYGESLHLAGVPRKERELHNWGFSVVDPGSYIARMVRTRGGAPPQMVEQVYMGAEQK